MNVINEILREKDTIVSQNKPMNVKPAVISKTLMGPLTINKHFSTPSTSTKQTYSTFNDKVSSTSKSKISSARIEPHMIIAICEGRGNARGIVGLAAVDIHRPVLILSQIPDTQTYASTLAKLNIICPTEILIPATFVESATPNRLFTIINEEFPLISIKSIPRNEFNRNRGIQYLSSICADSYSSVILTIQHKFYAAAAVCTLIRYIENVRNIIYAPHSIKVEYQESEYTTVIDVDSANILNLVAVYKNNTGNKTMKRIKPSLLGIIDKCVTNVGRRLLRSNILQPPYRLNEIEMRHDCVQELLLQPHLLSRLHNVLVPLQTIENALLYGTLIPTSASNLSVKQLNYTLELKKILLAVEPLATELRETKHPAFKSIYNRLSSSNTYSNILKLIANILNEDSHFAKGQAGELQRCFAVKSGINGFLDLSRKIYTEIVDNMRSHAENLSEEYNLPIRVQYNSRMGFHLILPLIQSNRYMKITDFPDVFHKIEKYVNHFSMTTMDMIKFGKRLRDISSEIQSLSNVIIYQLLKDIRPYIGNLYQLCDDVAFLDMLISFALSSTAIGYVRPRFSTSYIHLENFKHPLLEYTLETEPVTNSVCMTEKSNVHIITGPNMSGKTIYVRALCLIQILSQLGCRVPAQKAIIRPCDRLYVQFSNENTLECGGMSTFALEINKLAYLLQSMTDSSFVVIDELCRSTSCDEGMSIAFAICEELVQRKAFCFVVTHYLSLTVLADLYPNVTNWHFAVIEQLKDNNKFATLKFTYKKQPDVTKIDAYAIKLAQICINSKSIVNRAEELWNWMSPNGKVLKVNKSNNINFFKHKTQAELQILKITGELTLEMEKLKLNQFKLFTGVDLLSLDTNIELISSSEIENDKNNKSSSNKITNSNNQTSIFESNSQNIFSLSNSTIKNSLPNIFSIENRDISNNSVQSFSDPLNIILKSKFSNSTATKKQGNYNIFDEANSVSTITSECNKVDNLPTDLRNYSCLSDTFIATNSNNEKTPDSNLNTLVKPLVSDLYNSSSSSSSSSDEDEIDFVESQPVIKYNELLSNTTMDEENFVSTIQNMEGVYTSTPIKRYEMNDSPSYSPISTYDNSQNYDTLLKISRTSEIIISIPNKKYRYENN